MKNQSREFLVWALLLLLAGCASVTKQPPAQPSEQVVIPYAINEDVFVEPEPEPVVSGNPAIIALLDRARFDTEAGQREAAGASLERALRIEPRNAWLWRKLAQLRLAQGQYAQAIAIAQKSTSFAGGDRRLQSLNWRLIGDARVAQGNPSEAEQAFKHATELEQ